MKTPRQLIKLFFGTLLFTFLTVVLSAYIFANTFLKHHLLGELGKIFPAELKVGYIASDLFSYISMKNVTFRTVPGRTKPSAAGNTCEVSFDSLSLNGSVFDAIAKKADLTLVFKGLNITLKSDGRKIYFPDNLGINELDITAAGNSAFLNFFRAIVFDDCAVTFELYDEQFRELKKSVTLKKFGAKMSLADRANLKFAIASGFEYNDETFRIENINYEGALNVNNMVLDGRLRVAESAVSNSMFKNSPVVFDAKFSCDYDFTLYLSMLGRRMSDYLAGKANFLVSGGNVRLNVPLLGRLPFNALSGTLCFNPADSRVGLKDFSARAFNSHIDISGEIDLAARKMDLAFDSREFIAPLEIKKFETMEVAMKADVRLIADYGKGLYSVIPAVSNVNIVNLKRKILASLSSVTGEVFVDNSCDTLSLKDFSCGFRSGALSLDCVYDRRAETLSGKVGARSIDFESLEELMKHFGVTADRRLKVKKLAAEFGADVNNMKLSSLKGACELDGYPLVSKDIRIEGFEYQYAAPNIVFNNIRFDTPLAGRPNTASGKYDTAAGTYSFSARDFLADVSKSGYLKNFSGLYAVNVDCEGGGGRYRVDFDANIRQVKFNGRPTNFSRLSGALKKDGDHYTLSGVEVDDCVTIKHGTIDKNLNFNMEAGLYEVSVDRVRNFIAGDALAKLSGAVSGKINAAGNLYEPDRVNTSTELKSVSLAYEKIKIKNISSVKIKNHKTRLDFDSFNLAVNGHSVKIDGFVDYAGSGEVSLNLKLDDTDLKVLKLYASEHIEDISGKCDVEGRLSGSPGEVKFDGAVGLNAKNIKLKGVAEPISEFVIQLESRNFDVAVKKGVMKFAGTEWEIGGKAMINYKESPLYLDMFFECKNMKLNFKDKALIEGSSKLGLKGEITHPRLYGSCRVSKAKIELDANLLKTKAEPVRVGPIELDIIIFADKNVWLSNNFINAELKGKFNVKTVKENLAYTGDIAAVRGVVNFNGHEFQIDNGKLQFNDNPAFDPLFNIDAHTNIDVFKIMLRISGSTSKPDFQLSSQPALTQPEITALLTTGRASNDLNSKDAAAMPAKMYADYQKEKILGGLKKSVKKGLDLDELSVKGSGTDEKGRRVDNSVTVGKYVNDKLFVNYTEAKEQNTDAKVKSYKFNYKLNKNTDLDIKESNADGSEVGVKVKRNF